MNNKSIRMVVSLSLNALFIAIAVVVVVMFGTKAYTFGNNIFNEKSVDTVDNAKVVEVTKMRLNLHIQNLKYYCCWLKMPE